MAGIREPALKGGARTEHVGLAAGGRTRVVTPFGATGFTHGEMRIGIRTVVVKRKALLSRGFWKLAPHAGFELTTELLTDVRACSI